MDIRFESANKSVTLDSKVVSILVFSAATLMSSASGYVAFRHLQNSTEVLSVKQSSKVPIHLINADSLINERLEVKVSCDDKDKALWEDAQVGVALYNRVLKKDIKDERKIEIIGNIAYKIRACASNELIRQEWTSLAEITYNYMSINYKTLEVCRSDPKIDIKNKHKYSIQKRNNAAIINGRLAEMLGDSITNLPDSERIDVFFDVAKLYLSASNCLKEYKDIGKTHIKSIEQKATAIRT